LNLIEETNKELEYQNYKLSKKRYRENNEKKYDFKISNNKDKLNSIKPQRTKVSYIEDKAKNEELAKKKEENPDKKDHVRVVSPILPSKMISHNNKLGLSKAQIGIIEMKSNFMNSKEKVEVKKDVPKHLSIKGIINSCKDEKTLERKATSLTSNKEKISNSNSKSNLPKDDLKKTNEQPKKNMIVPPKNICASSNQNKLKSANNLNTNNKPKPQQPFSKINSIQVPPKKIPIKKRYQDDYDDEGEDLNDFIVHDGTEHRYEDENNYNSEDDIPEADLSDMMKEEDITRRIGEEEDMREEQRERLMKLRKLNQIMKNKKL